MTAPRTNIKYINRDFASLKQDLLDYVKLVYPDQYQDFSEASVGMMLLELNAYVGDVLSYALDKRYNEMFLETAEQRQSLFRLARNLGYKPRGKRGSATLVDLEITVPVSGDTFDNRYALTYERGISLQSENGTIFEILEDVDFNNANSFRGNPNREVIPVKDNDGNIVEYTLRKRVVATAGESVTEQFEVTTDNARPYMTWTLSNDNILEIRNLIDSDVGSFPNTESEWVIDRDRIWYEVDYLAQNKVFIDTSTGQTASTRVGFWKEVDKRFESNYDEFGNLTLTFGAGVQNFDLYSNWLASGATQLETQQLLNNSSMGVIPSPGSYLQIRYRRGGGQQSNVPAKSINRVLDAIVSYVPGEATVGATELAAVQRSLSCSNPIPAIGGADSETNNEIRFMASSNFAAQDRVVTLDDYENRCLQMPSQYGTVFRVHAANDQSNFVTRLYVLTRDETGRLKNTGNDLIKNNLASYLERYRLLNDVVEIHDGRIINIGIDFTVLVENGLNKRRVVYQCIQELKDYFHVENWQMAQTIYIGQIYELLREVQGVVNVTNVSIINKYGGSYSSDVLPEALLEGKIVRNTGANKILPVNNAVKCSVTSMFEIKYPTKDIVGRAL